MFSKKKFDFTKIKIGDYAEVSEKMTIKMVESFANISKDFNPIHLNKSYALKSRYKGQIIHGLMAVSLFSGLFGTKLPGEGCVYKLQNIFFKRPIYVDDIVLAKIEIVSIDIKKKIIKFKTSCYVSNKIVIDGAAEIFIP
jgi:3-hydroxybutyryl-CoA dehydratase